MSHFGNGTRVRVDGQEELTGTIVGWGVCPYDGSAEFFYLLMLDKGQFLENAAAFVSVMVVHVERVVQIFDGDDDED